MNPLSEVEWSAAYRYEQIFSKSHVSFTTSASMPYTANITVPHNLGYVPFFRTFFQFAGDSNYYMGFNGPTVLLGDWTINDINADTANLNASVNNFANQSSGVFYYRIYEEPQAAS